MDKAMLIEFADALERAGELARKIAESETRIDLTIDAETFAKAVFPTIRDNPGASTSPSDDSAHGTDTTDKEGRHMTNRECEQRILDLMSEAWRIFKEYDPRGDHLSMFGGEKGWCAMGNSIDNGHTVLEIDCYKSPSGGYRFTEGR